jgi:hypothetical protein
VGVGTGVDTSSSSRSGDVTSAGGGGAVVTSLTDGENTSTGLVPVSKVGVDRSSNVVVTVAGSTVRSGDETSLGAGMNSSLLGGGESGSGWGEPGSG